jgi:hypothetical protein
MLFFTIGEYIAGMITGAVTALAVRMVVSPGMDMVVAMMLGMGLGMVIHIVLGLMASPLVGMFATMMPGSVIGMYGGMLFAMRDSMAAGSATKASAALVGAAFGAVIVAAVQVYDRVLRGPVVLDAEE